MPKSEFGEDVLAVVHQGEALATGSHLRDEHALGWLSPAHEAAEDEIRPPFRPM